MSLLTEDAWALSQRGCDRCPVCQRDPVLMTTEPTPARPWWPEHTGRSVLISEAPPVTGGFWQAGQYDDLREQLFCILQGRGRPFPSDLHGDPALRAFMRENLFLLQTVKWPFAKGRRKRRPSFNNLGRRAQEALIDHTMAAHLGPELALLEPAAVLAMGTAAWQACASLICGEMCEVPIGQARGKSFAIALAGRSIPLEVALLPVDQNMRRVGEAALIRDDIAKFVTRHRSD
jgi:uracil-DNA glycosylase